MDLSAYESLKLSTEMDGRVVLLRFDHGKANEMGSVELQELEQLTRDLEQDPASIALITYSERVSRRGTPIFVAGANVTERAGWDDERVKAHVAWQRSVLAGLKAAPVLHIGVISGVALGWGTEYLLCCDYRIACAGSSFALPETGLGILPGAGGTSELWAHIGVAQTLRLGMTGERILPDEACRIGLVQEVAEDLVAGLSRARALAALAAKRSPTANAAFKQSVLAAVGRDPSDRHVLEEIAYAHCVDSGQAAVGRAHFADIRAGQAPPWGPRVRLGGSDATSG